MSHVQHVLFVPSQLLTPLSQVGASLPASLIISGDEAHHALRVKRLVQGDMVRLHDGAGVAAEAVIASTRKIGKVGWELTVQVSHAQLVPQTSPCVHLYGALPKGDLLEHMIDQLSQCGVARFVPLMTSRSVTGAESFKRERLERIVDESLKQCGRAWRMELGEPVRFADVVTQPASTVLADAMGASWASVACKMPAGIGPLRILVGPEGGFSPSEIALAQASGISLVRCGPHVLRIETAAVVMAGLAMGSGEVDSSSLAPFVRA